MTSTNTHTWLIPYGGSRRSLHALTESIITCGRPTAKNQVVVVDDTEHGELGNALSFLGIKIVRNEGEHSCAHALNRGLLEVATEWVWRMDADDTVSSVTSDREKSCNDATPDVVCCCGEMINQFGLVMQLKWSNMDKLVQLLTLHRNPIYHPATCIRTSALRQVGGWPTCSPVEDYGLWCKLVKIGNFTASTHIWTNYHHWASRPPVQSMIDEIAVQNGW